MINWGLAQVCLVLKPTVLSVSFKPRILHIILKRWINLTVFNFFPLPFFCFILAPTPRPLSPSQSFFICFSPQGIFLPNFQADRLLFSSAASKMSFLLAHLILLVTVRISSFLSGSKGSSVWPTPASSTSSAPFLADPLPCGSRGGLWVLTALSKLLLSSLTGRTEKPSLPQTLTGTCHSGCCSREGTNAHLVHLHPNRSRDLSENKNFGWFYWKCIFPLFPAASQFVYVLHRVPWALLSLSLVLSFLSLWLIVTQGYFVF